MDWSTMIYDALAPVTLDSTIVFASARDVLFLVDDLHPIKIGTLINPRTGLPEDDLLFRGFYIKRSEVGKSALKIAARAICCNCIMWGVEGSRSHLTFGSEPEAGIASPLLGKAILPST
jgi:hypothetical protein